MTLQPRHMARRRLREARARCRFNRRAAYATAVTLSGESKGGAATSTVTTTPDTHWEWGLRATVILTLVRLAAMRLSPLQLYADEAQYWVWSRHLAFGYFTKPPLIAWLIRLTTLFGDAEPFVRVSSPLLHAAAGLFLFRAALRLYDSRTALFALLVYALTPAVQLGAFVVSTDTPLMACLAAALWAYAALQVAPARERITWAAALGLTLGLAFLAKYAAPYAVAGVAAHLALSAEARRVWTPKSALAALVGFGLMAAPNLVWNAMHGLASFGHVAREAAWGARTGGIVKGLEFLGDQFGVFGPLPFAVLLVGAPWLALRRRLTSADGLLLAWTLPALLAILTQAFIAGAKANWAVAAYGPASILVAAWLLRWARPRLLIAALAFQAVVAVAGLAVEVRPQLADQVGLSKALRGVRGGREVTQLIADRAQAETLFAPLSAVAIDDRELFNLAAYYGRDYFGKNGPPLTAWRSGPAPENEAQLSAPLTPALGRHVLAVSRDGAWLPQMRAQFRSAGPADFGDVWLDRKNQIKIQMFVGDGFQPPGR
jgi:4-amino-4-deoxy-L-arabinose transferase-like glycosyltransferase